MKFIKSGFVRCALVAALAVPTLALAESQLVVGTGSAVARLDFKIVIPRVLFLAVGTGNATIANNTTVDDVIFDYTTNPADLGTGLAAGSITGNAVTVRVMGNNGQIQITSSNAGALNNGGATPDTIAWSQITAVSADAANFPTPAPSGATVNVAVSSGKVTTRTTTWTYSYANSAVVPPGSYGATDGTQNGRLTYTAAMP